MLSGTSLNVFYSDLSSYEVVLTEESKGCGFVVVVVVNHILT